MNIAILSRGKDLYSTNSLINAAEKRNQNISVINPDFCNVLLEGDSALIQYHDTLLEDFDAVVPRISVGNTYFGSSIVRHFEAMHVFCAVSSQGILNSRDKWVSFQTMAKAGIPLPKTTLSIPAYAEDFLKDFGKKPVIIKLLEGTHGEGVILCETYQNALATMEALHSVGTKFIIQEYIAESKGTDIRAIVIDGEVVAAMKRRAKNGEFRSNLHRGGSSEIFNLSSEEKNIALRAAKALDLDVCGVDLLPSENGMLVLEVNSTPGLEGIEKTTGIDVAGKIIRYLERNKR